MPCRPANCRERDFGANGNGTTFKTKDDCLDSECAIDNLDRLRMIVIKKAMWKWKYTEESAISHQVSQWQSGVEPERRAQKFAAFWSFTP